MWCRFIAAPALTVLVIAGCGGAGSHSNPASKRAGGSRGRAAVARGERAQIRAVVHRFNEASPAGDTRAMCALVDPSKLQYLEQIGQPCEVSLGGTLTAESERDVRSTAIAAIDISGDGAIAHMRSTSGARDLRLHRRRGRWLIVGV